MEKNRKHNINSVRRHHSDEDEVNFVCSFCDVS